MNPVSTAPLDFVLQTSAGPFHEVGKDHLTNQVIHDVVQALTAKQREKGLSWKYVTAMLCTKFDNNFTEQAVRNSFKTVKDKRTAHQKNSKTEVEQYLSEQYKPPAMIAKRKRKSTDDTGVIIPPDKRLNLDDSLAESHHMALADIMKENTEFDEEEEPIFQTVAEFLADIINGTFMSKRRLL